MYNYCTCMSLPMIAISTMIQRIMRGILGYFWWQTFARCEPEKKTFLDMGYSVKSNIKQKKREAFEPTGS